MPMVLVLAYGIYVVGCKARILNDPPTTATTKRRLELPEHGSGQISTTERTAWTQRAPAIQAHFGRNLHPPP